tara:strand:+ start:193 stop:327 length:135 start_codon:yes stop_codon:yes gene_type:complete
MPNKRTGPDYLDKKPKSAKKKKTESLIERLKRQKKEKEALINSM